MATWKKEGKRKDRREWKGSYMRDLNGERVFVLTSVGLNGIVRNITFESARAAKKAGWIKVL